MAERMLRTAIAVFTLCAAAARQDHAVDGFRVQRHAEDGREHDRVA
jgi:hypothetical protein